MAHSHMDMERAFSSLSVSGDSNSDHDSISVHSDSPSHDRMAGPSTTSQERSLNLQFSIPAHPSTPACPVTVKGYFYDDVRSLNRRRLATTYTTSLVLSQSTTPKQFARMMLRQMHRQLLPARLGDRDCIMCFVSFGYIEFRRRWYGGKEAVRQRMDLNISNWQEFLTSLLNQEVRELDVLYSVHRRCKQTATFAFLKSPQAKSETAARPNARFRRQGWRALEDTD